MTGYELKFHPRGFQGPRLARGHRHVGGNLVRSTPEERHWAIAAIVAAVVAAGASAYATYNQYQQQAAQTKYNQQVATANARAAQDQAAANAEMVRTRAAKVLAAQRAAYGASGVTLEGSSPLAVQADSAFQAEMDAQRQLYEGNFKAWGYDTQAAYFRWQHNNLVKNQWPSTIISGVAAGVSTYAGMGGRGGGGYTASAAPDTAAPAYYQQDQTGTTLLSGSAQVPRYRSQYS